MTWFKVDDGLHKHRKRIRAGVEAMGLWVIAGSWSADELTDGWIPEEVVDYLAPATGRDLAKRLEHARLWEHDVRDGEAGWQFHEWTDQQPTRDEVKAVQERKSSGGALGNHRRWHVKEGKTDPKCRYCRTPDQTSDRPTNRSTDRTSDRSPIGNGDSEATRTRVARPGPDPTRPGPVVTEVTTSEDQTLFPAPMAQGDAKPARPAKLPDTHRFDEFWAAYPHKRDKDDGRKAWAKIVRESQRNGTDVVLDDVIAAAGFYRYSKDFVTGFPKHPATFLNKGSWRDFVAGPPSEPRVPVQGGLDARVAEFDVMRDRLRNRDAAPDSAAALIRTSRPELTAGGTP